MVKIVKSLMVIILFSSCCDHYLTPLGGLRSKEKYKKYLDKRVNPENFEISTKHLYFSIDYKYEEVNKRFSKIEDSVTLNRNSYLRFYKDGLFYYFLENKKIKLKRQVFNPQKGNPGFLIRDKKKQIKIVDYGPVNCGSFSENEIIVKGDTLKISAGSNKGYRIWYYYIKKEVPKEWLDWKPDF